MTHRSCTWVLLLGLLWIFPVSPVHGRYPYQNLSMTLDSLFTSPNKTALVGDKFYDVVTNITNGRCAAFVDRNTTSFNTSLGVTWPQWVNNQLYISKHLINLNFSMYVFWGRGCNETFFQDTDCHYNLSDTESCNARCIQTGTACQKSMYDEKFCNASGNISDSYIINLTATNLSCISCNNPVKKPEASIQMTVSVTTTQDGKVDAGSAVKVMSNMADVVSSMNKSSAEISAGEGITGVLVAHKDPRDIEHVSFCYGQPNGSIDILNSEGNVNAFSRSVSVSKEAFEKARSMNVTISFAALMRFNNMERDALNSTVLNNEVVAVEMGASIANLTDPINITFRNLNYDMIPTCHSWNGQGNQTNWTQDGCVTIVDGSTITCQCSHLTFFAILMTPSRSISSTELNNLTIITQVGCGLSLFFLSIVLFMHFLMRKTTANISTRMLIHLVTAMSLLDLTFLINNFVAKLKSSLGCTILGALMHYFMLATFTWFAAHAFHLCLQLYTRGQISIRRYILKVSITSWILPSVIGTALLASDKYGESLITIDNSTNTVAMCWITDLNVHYIVNIGYYALVFVFTFTTFIVIVSWLICLRRHKGGAKVMAKGVSIMSIMGLCCLLGLTWGFAFFAYGVLQVPAYYIFTILNSFQGFFLFIYYYNTRQTQPDSRDTSNTTKSSTTTLQTTADVMNPYMHFGNKK